MCAANIGHVVMAMRLFTLTFATCGHGRRRERDYAEAVVQV